MSLVASPGTDVIDAVCKLTKGIPEAQPEGIETRRPPRIVANNLYQHLSRCPITAPSRGEVTTAYCFNSMVP